MTLILLDEVAQWSAEKSKNNKMNCNSLALNLFKEFFCCWISF